MNVLRKFAKNVDEYEIKLQLLQEIADCYNELMERYSDSYKSKLSKPKNIKDIPKQYSSINDYINSKKIWLQILKFVKINPNMNIIDYISTMIKNWNWIKDNMNLTISNPCAKIVFSNGMKRIYYRLKDIEKVKTELNKNIVINSNNDNLHKLHPTLQNDINSLFRLKNSNPDLKYHDIIKIFKGEFCDKFINFIIGMKEEEINTETVTVARLRGI